MRITVLGGTGYTGGHIVQKAAAAGHKVVSYSRSTPVVPIENVDYRLGSLLDSSTRAAAVAESDVVVAALAPRDDLESGLQSVYEDLAALAAQRGVRLVVIGGFSALRPSEGAPRFLHSGDVPPEFATEVHVMGEILERLLNDAPASLDWLYISPAAEYGTHAPGEETGQYRTSGEIALFDADGRSAISGQDFAAAVIAEISASTRHREQLSVAY